MTNEIGIPDGASPHRLTQQIGVLGLDLAKASPQGCFLVALWHPRHSLRLLLN
ncbi:hypothetical protein MRBLWO14_001806 [Microbacterium sp. LWO14-1.2]|uniref:hypothetical protein n=1 Tax=Microbacterium sp. LWO14-1.2 TaxID=3135263 RepID=UPI0031388A26